MRLDRRAALLVALWVWFFLGAGTTRASCSDLDRDGFGRGADCPGAQDCNDRDPEIYPGRIETCNGFDDNCDGVIDEGCVRNCQDFSTVATREISPMSLDAELARARGGWTAAWGDSPSDDYTYRGTRLSTAGVPLAPIRVFAKYVIGGVGLAWTGAEIVGGHALDDPMPGAPGTYAGDYGRWGRRIEPDVTLSSGRRQGIYDLVWSGGLACYMLFDRWLYTSVSTALVSTAPFQLQSTALIDQADPRYNPIDLQLAWNGSFYVSVYSRKSADVFESEEIFFRALNADCANPGSEIRVSNHIGYPPPAYGTRPKVASKGLGQGYGVVWTDNRTGRKQIWMAILDAQGHVVSPPGEFRLSNSQVSDVNDSASISWNGDEFMVVWINSDLTLTQFGKVMGTRVSNAGEILQTRVIDGTLVNQLNGYGDRIAWSGGMYGVLYEKVRTMSPDEDLYFSEVACNCVLDGDHDGQTACNGDCDDGDAAIAGNKAEICTDGKDNDCDGLVDCNDSNCAQSGFKPPEEKGVKLLSDKKTITWTADPLSFSYDLARGSLIDLVDQESFSSGSCLASKLVPAQAIDTAVPLPGDGYYYLVRGRRSGCLVGTWGAGQVDSTLTGCP